ncbi:tryptophan synthase subunit alpha [Flavobacterium silvaticum]|uniref:Tryptophan synthase alpha chain n=1 Tax=Flavobacterium silvaticum TaxID=1852020 RepID=A0A972FJA5_9FLAO|nr:tryptophan synthase subunit alpha [Flavobacterium silvaticum]NMH26808.1 tryptophan synthase subunit alpha [Flavobacterium silvaticum]
MDRIKKQIDKSRASAKKIISVYFTAGFPELHDTTEIIRELEKSGADMIEIGLPFSDPLADGPVIQHSSSIAISNGINAKVLFEQLSNIRESVQIPLILMAYLNPLLQYGFEDFCENCQKVGIDGLIIPDLPPEQFETDYVEILDRYNLKNILLVTPQTSDDRIRYIDSLSTGFTYLVSSPGVTGNNKVFSNVEETYFKRIAALNLQNPCIAGFGIHDKKSFESASRYSDGGIIGSSFIRQLEKEGIKGISQFINKFR